MGLDTRRPPLPAPTEPSTLSSSDPDHGLRDDIATDLSTRTDKTSYSIPEDGTPVTINTVKKQGAIHKKYPSQTSLLIEYFEGGKTEGKAHSRPSVRVRVTPSSRKSKSHANDHLQITQTSRNTRKPSYTRRISLGSKPRDELVHTADASYSEESNVSSLPPVDIEVLQTGSDLSSDAGRYIPPMSDISSMPPDSMLEEAPVIKAPRRRRSRSLERDAVVETVTKDTLKAPTRQRSRSLSKERITQRVMEKLGQKPIEASSSKAKETKVGREDPTASRKSHRRTSKGSRDEELSAISGTESSLLSSNAHRRSGESRSIVSGVSGTSSINNPKLLATVEDAIRRLILPELDALKEEQRSNQNRNKFERMSHDSTYETIDSTASRDQSRRRVSKSSSAPHIHGNKPKVVLNRSGDDPGTILSGNSSRKERRSSRGSVSDRSYAESMTRDEEKVHRKKSEKSRDKDRHSTRDAVVAGLAGAGLTAAALRHHDSRESKDERKERRKKHSRGSRSRTASISESVEDDHYRSKHMAVPPLPILQSELQGSEMTRDSILSAETETRDRPSSRSSRGTGTGAETPIRQVPRGIVSPSRTPTRTPVALQQRLGTAHSNKSIGEIGLATPKSERSYTSRTKEVSSAGLESAAAAKVRALESSEPQASQFEIAEQTPTRGLSPVQSEASYREEITATGSPRQLRSVHSAASASSTGRKAQRQPSNLSIQSFESTPSTKAAHTRRRPQGVTLEDGREILGEPESPRDIDDFFQKNHEQNEIYRRELDSEQGSPVDYRRMTNYTDDSAELSYLDREDKTSLGQDIRKVGSNPNFVHTPLAVESAVASLHEPSNISVRSSPLNKSRFSQVSPVNEQHEQQYESREAELHEHPSQERWGAIRNQAQTLKEHSQATNSPRQSLSRSIDEAPQMHASAFPTDDHMMPAIGYGVDDDSDVMTNPSFIQGPRGGSEYDRTEELLSRQEERERTPTHSYGKAAAIGVGAGAGAAAIAAAAAARLRNEDSAAHDGQYHDHQEVDYDQDYAGEHQYEQQPNFAHENRTPSRSPTMWKDEGYQSANPHGGITPEFRNRSKLLDDDGLGEYDEAGEGGADIFALNGKHSRHFSGNSHGMASPLYDSATGKGIDRIQSKDVVALMDHLTVRDAQRNARDTEILVTLVRSAAEMRNQFEEMKQFIRTQDSMIMNNADKRADLTEQRILGGPRPQPLGSPRFPRSSSEDMDLEQKKKNVFKRALKGLSMKGDGDIKKIEAMLMQLLGEVEGLKQVHQLSLEQQQTNRSNSLTSYENLRASGDAGYEPEGRANTASSPNQSGYLSNPSSRRIQDLHSGLDVHQAHRISTVEEDDEEYAEQDGQYENTERMTTPTQEVRRNNSMPQVTPPQASRAFREPQSQENTPKRKHKSNSSSIFGIPKISRWSKTTASTNPESLPRNSGSGEKHPYSTASRSGSQVNVAYYGDGQYELQQDDRLRSNTSLVADERRSIRSERSIRSASPLIPDEELDANYVLDDPKYQAHRNSLNLQHPQPRPGPTGRHQNHLEHQAHIFEPIGSLGSPDYDQWGSNPSLARNRLSGGGASQGPGNLSPISSDGGYSQHSASEQQAAPPRPPKIRDDGPLIPPQPLAGHGQTRQMYSSPTDFATQGGLTPLAPIQEVRYSLETDTGHHYSPTPSPRPNQNLNPAAAMVSPQRKITGPRPMGSRSPSGQRGLSGQGQLDHSGTVIRRKPVAGT
ncbi:hypothetical protein K505DRAFT_140006 [Melanomma pulvis-pyrius CBS 109.77]|uniref:Uncharacterized protein n=1 Tax=Melanomma pulvis-pyrius CBS 109.77 TaxID=1314802 RepID=A0A6A6WS12_9PLEO|nr:hypothetical protein K505DRAFT_140006 [Melanomma pulvis-pyrius CBS 109.77]